MQHSLLWQSRPEELSTGPRGHNEVLNNTIMNPTHAALYQIKSELTNWLKIDTEKHQEMQWYIKKCGVPEGCPSREIQVRQLGMFLQDWKDESTP